MNASLYLLTFLFIAAQAKSANNTLSFIIVNNSYRGQADLKLTRTMQPCLTAPLLEEWGLHLEKAQLRFSDQGCALTSSLADHHIRFWYNTGASMLTLSIPPEQVSNLTNGVATSRWNDGINAAFIDYDLSYSHYTGDTYRRAPRQHSLDLLTTYGVNLGAWRFRYTSVFTKDTWSNPRWYTENASAFRTIKPLRALLTLGDGTTSSDMFDSVSYRGFSLASDDRMLPDALRPPSPWIYGFARTPAQVRIRQYGTIIYQVSVPAGAFILKDVSPREASGDIEMTIKEEDGTETVRTIPWSVMPNLVQGDRWKFALSVGKYRPYYTLDEEQPLFSQLTASYGLPENFTLYAGVLGAGIYQAEMVGIGKRLDRWGAISIDFGLSCANDPRRDSVDRGAVARLRYAKAFSEWQSSFNLTAQYYPNQRYRTFSEAISQQTQYWWDWDDGSFVGEFEAEKKNNIAASYVHNFNEEDNVYLTLASEALRGRHKRETTLELGYSGSWRNMDYSLSAEYNRPNGEKEESKVTFSLSVPFQLFSSRRIKLNLENSLAKNSAASRKVGITGTALDDYSLSYNLSNTTEEGTASRQKMTVDYQYSAGEVMAIYARQDLSSSKYVGLTGSVVAHQGGITPGQRMGETVAIVEVTRTAGIGIINQYGTTTDSRGFAVIGNLTPYRANELSLDTFNLPVDRQLPVSEMEVVLTVGAIMYSRFNAPTIVDVGK